MKKIILRNRVKVARAEKDLSQEELAKLAGVTRQTIGSIESGEYCPSAQLAFLLARRLDKKVEDLFFLEGDEIMNDQLIIRDERTRTVENEGYRIGFIILCFGVLVDIFFRSILNQESVWDLFALVVISSWTNTIYIGLHKALPPNFLRSALLLGLATALLSAAMVIVIVNFRH